MPADYKPKPDDLTDAKLPESLSSIMEELSKHLHNVWVQERLNDGWVLGPERSDRLKQHPCLIPYEELPERERDYDRNMAIHTLKYIIHSGYRISAPDQPLESDAQSDFPGILEQLNSKSHIPPWELRKLWEERMEHFWAFRPVLYELLAKTLLKRGFPLWAIEVLVEGLKVAPESVALRQQYALGLMRTGRPLHARRILDGLIAENESHRTGETLGLLASSYKTSWRNARNERERKASLDHCYEIYLQAFEQTGEYYPGINAATMAVVRGELEAGKKIAAQVQQICQTALQQGDLSYWNLATLGEATLILGQTGEAARFYSQAVEAAPDNIDSISATRRQAIVLTEKLGLDDSAILDALPVAPVVVFAGPPCWKDDQIHLPEIEDEVDLRNKFREQIRQSGYKVGYATGTGVGDLLFLETLIEENGSAHLILPAPADDLLRLANCFGPRGEAWAARLHHVLAQASEVTVVSRDLGSANPEVFHYSNRMMVGAASLKSKSLGTSLEWVELQSTDSEASGEPIDKGFFSQVIRIPAVKLNWGTSIPTSTDGLKSEVKGILFADLKAYSKMPESEVPLYVSKFLSEAGALCDAEPSIQFRNSWGDAFYLVFDSVPAAARFAKRLRSFVTDTDWREHGFSQNFEIRISLHAGPLFIFEDPVLHTQTYSGQHTSRGARIEPITDEGQIFVSEPFACLAAGENAADLEFEYLGRRSLSKKYGEEGLFMLM